MIDFIKDSTEAWMQRIRSPVFGSIGLAFVAFNWKPIWYLLFAEQSVAVKFRYFDLNTTIPSIYFWPLATGITFAVLTPWVKFCGAWMATRPVGLLRRLQFDQSHEQKVYRLNREIEVEETLERLEIASARLQEAKERKAIEAAQRIEEAEKIQGSGVVDEIISQRAEDKEDFNAQELLEKIGEADEAAITILANENSPVWTSRLAEEAKVKNYLSTLYPNMSNVRAEVELEASFSKLKDLGLTSDHDQSKWQLTQKGFQVFDLISNS